MKEISKEISGIIRKVSLESAIAKQSVQYGEATFLIF